MAQSITTMLRDGQQYMETWPMEKPLFALFPECRVIAATRFSVKFMPPVAVLTLTLLLNHYGMDYLPQAIAVAAFFLSLPMQGLLWLGHRSNQLLSPAMRQWYQDIHRKMQGQGCRVQSLKSRPRYFELARLLKTAFDELDKVFTQKWF